MINGNISLNNISIIGIVDNVHVHDKTIVVTIRHRPQKDIPSNKYTFVNVGFRKNETTEEFVRLKRGMVVRIEGMVTYKPDNEYEISFFGKTLLLFANKSNFRLMGLEDGEFSQVKSKDSKNTSTTPSPATLAYRSTSNVSGPEFSS